MQVTSLSDAKDVAPSVASLLIDGGSSVDEQDENGFTALHFAVINNNADLVKLYLQRGASINIPAFPTYCASSCIQEESDESRWIPSGEKCGLSPLWFAAKFLPSGSRCEELLLLASGANVTDPCRKHCPLVAVCSKEGFEGALRYIRSPGFDINHRHPLYGTHLINAVVTYSAHEPSEFSRLNSIYLLEFMTIARYAGSFLLCLTCYNYSFILETYIAPLQETTTQMRFQRNHGQRRWTCSLADSMLIIGLRLFDDALISEMICVKFSIRIHCT